MKRNKLHLVVGFIALAVSALFIVGGVMLLSIPGVSEHLTKFWTIALAVLCFIIGFFAIQIAFAGFAYNLKDYKLEEQKRKENLEAIERFNERIEAQNKVKEEQDREELRRQNERNRQEHQHKLREQKEKEKQANEEFSANMEKIKVYLNAVFRHALAEREKYQGGYKCKIKLVSEEYKVENGKLLVTFKVSVVVLESVGEFEYGSSWVDKQGRFHGSTTEADARKSARRAVESVQLYAISELEKELNWCYGDNHLKISYKGYVIVPLPRDRVSMKVELTNSGAGKYDIRVR